MALHIVHLNMISNCNQKGIEIFETWRGRLLWLWAYSRCLRASSRCSVSSWHRSSWRNNFLQWDNVQFAKPMCNVNYRKKELLQKRKPNFTLRAEFLPPLPDVTDPVSKSAGNLKVFSYRWSFLSFLDLVGSVIIYKQNHRLIDEKSRNLLLLLKCDAAPLCNQDVCLHLKVSAQTNNPR